MQQSMASARLKTLPDSWQHPRRPRFHPCLGASAPSWWGRGLPLSQGLSRLLGSGLCRCSRAGTAWRFCCDQGHGPWDRVQGSHGGCCPDGTLVLEEGSMPLAVPSQGQGGQSRGPRSGVGLSIQSWGPSRVGTQRGGWHMC